MCDADECMYEDSSDAEEEEEVEDGLQFSSDEEIKGAATGTVSVTGPSFHALSADTISKMMFDIVDEVNVVFQLPTPYVRLLLIACKWDKEKLLERYYAGDQEALFKEAHVVPPQRRQSRPDAKLEVRTQSTAACGAAALPGQEFICDICMLAYAFEVMCGLECGHYFCRECWDSYLQVMVMCEGRGQSIQCPASHCAIVVDEVTVLKLLRQPEVRRKYQFLITSSFVQDHPHLKWCPAPGCSYAILCTNADLRPVTCDCSHTFCFKCCQSPHEPVLCEYLRRWHKKCDDDSETSNWIHVNTKECPKCRATIEKNGGCNHMVCSTCRCEYCWVCLGPWEPHGSSWYHCNRYNEKECRDARDQQASSRAALERYLFYCNRYMNHMKSLKMEHKLYEMAHAKMQELQTMNVSWIEAQFMRQAVDVLCQCRQTLMYSYSFAFYLKKNNHTFIFEDNQGDLEMATECLSECLERDITKDTLANMKTMVQDKTK